VGTRAVVIQDGRTADVPPGDYEVEGFFSRLANLGRDRYAEILITRQAALPVREGGDDSRRVPRGGSWDNFPRNLRAANRFRYTPDFRSISTGFRIARTS
jgi:formylglycine-generating enzyme required for sulfatase activity